MAHTVERDNAVYVLCAGGSCNVFFVQLVPRMQLKEEEKIEQRSRTVVPGKPEVIQATFIEKLKEQKANQRYEVARFKRSGHIKSYHCDTETARHVPKARHVRLTIGARLMNTTTVIGIMTMIALLLWAVMPIHRLYHRLA